MCMRGKGEEDMERGWRGARDRWAGPGGPIEEFGLGPKSNGKPLKVFTEGNVW